MACEWDSSHNGGWVLSNSNFTATSEQTGTPFDTGATASVLSVSATTPIPTNSKVYFEVYMSLKSAYAPYAYDFLQTATCVGVWVRNTDITNLNSHDAPVATRVPNPGTYIDYSYNDSVTNSRYIVLDPNDNWDWEPAPLPNRTTGAGYGQPTYNIDNSGEGAAPSVWGTSCTLGFAFDTTVSPAQCYFYLNNSLRGGQAWECYDVAGMYPFITGWFGRGPIAEINGGGNGSFVYTPPSGFSALDGTTPPPATVVTVNEPSPFNVGTQTITGSWTGTNPTNVHLAWKGTAPTSYTEPDVVLATLNTSAATFSATITVDDAGASETMWYSVNETGWSVGFVATPGSGTPPVMTEITLSITQP